MNVVVFSGTTEGRNFSRALAALGAAVTVCVATELGAEEQGHADGITVRAGRLDAEGMTALLRGAALCVDATHPYATEATRNIRAAAQAVGVDIDPKAEDAARENAGYNGFGSPEFTALSGNVLEDRALMDSLKAESWDLVFVNIVADVIIGLSPVLPELMGKNTVVVCSGILDARLPDVKAALQRAGLEIISEKAKEDWRCVAARRSAL